jgi:hypothetical protein
VLKRTEGSVFFCEQPQLLVTVPHCLHGRLADIAPGDQNLVADQLALLASSLMSQTQTRASGAQG